MVRVMPDTDSSVRLEYTSRFTGEPFSSVRVYWHIIQSSENSIIAVVVTCAQPSMAKSGKIGGGLETLFVSRVSAVHNLIRLELKGLFLAG